MAGKTDETLITSYPGVLGGKPVIAGTRISVQLILEKLRDGWTLEDLLRDYPQLSRKQLDAALDYAVETMGSQPAAR